MDERARLEDRIRIERDGTVTALSGKVEFGQGIRTAFAQLVAEELDQPLGRVNVVLGDTAEAPWDAGTFGSRSIAHDGAVLRRAAAFAREQLLERASKRLGAPKERLELADGSVRVRGDAKKASFADLVAGEPLAGAIPEDVSLKPPDRHRIVGTPLPRVEARAIVTGAARYVADVRLPGMLRGHVLHPAVRGSRLRALDDRAAKAMPGVVAVVREGDFVGVVAERESQALAAVDALEADWEIVAAEQRETVDIPMQSEGDVASALKSAAKVLEATYSLPHISNAPIGPSAAVADATPQGVTVYAGTQRPFPLREQVAEYLGVEPEGVRIVPQMPSGTYGRNSVGDAALEAAKLSQLAGKPVLVQWTREEEFALGPTRPAAMLAARAGLAADGSISAWEYDEHTNAHGYSGRVDLQHAPSTSGRNAVPPYRLGASRITLHIEPTPVRTASFRSLAAAENVFAIESFMDELAHASKQDPVAFRLRHVAEPRLARVLEATAQRSGWPRKGLGIACTIYHGTFCAQAAEVDVDAAGRVRLVRMWCAIDPGLVINPDGVRNQTEGAMQQSASWTIAEELRHRDGRITTTGWDTYPIATFRDAPESIDVHVMGDPHAPSTGVGEPGSVPIAAAIANAVFSASGARVRDVPLSAERVRASSAAGASRTPPGR